MGRVDLSYPQSMFGQSVVNVVVDAVASAIAGYELKGAPGSRRAALELGATAPPPSGLPGRRDLVTRRLLPTLWLSPFWTTMTVIVPRRPSRSRDRISSTGGRRGYWRTRRPGPDGHRDWLRSGHTYRGITRPSGHRHPDHHRPVVRAGCRGGYRLAYGRQR